MPGEFRPAPGLSGGHLQSMLASASARRLLRWRRSPGPVARAHREVLETSAGVRLEAWTSRPPAARALAVLLHGWEGHAGSSYMLETAGRLLAAGFAVSRLNFRDHGDTHGLNREPFHSCRLAEVTEAIALLARRTPGLPTVVAGYSLGGNFALRVARERPVPLALALAVCPVIDPAASLAAIENGLPLYEAYFMRKWRRSLRRKQALFPERFPPDIAPPQLGIRELTARLVARYTDFGSLDAYLDGYTVAGERLAAVATPLALLGARDDPVIPAADFERLRLPPGSRCVLEDRGGHCGFIENWKLESWAARWVARQCGEAVAARLPERRTAAHAG